MPIWYQYEPGGEAWVLTEAKSRKARLIQEEDRVLSVLPAADRAVFIRALEISSQLPAEDTRE